MGRHKAIIQLVLSAVVLNPKSLFQLPFLGLSKTAKPLYLPIPASCPGTAMASSWCWSLPGAQGSPGAWRASPVLRRPRRGCASPAASSVPPLVPFQPSFSTSTLRRSRELPELQTVATFGFVWLPEHEFPRFHHKLCNSQYQVRFWKE